MLVTDASGAVVHVTQDWEDLTGQHPSQAQGTGWLDSVYADDRPVVADVIQRATLAKQQFVCDHRILTGAGEPRWVVFSGTPAISPRDGAFLGHLSAIAVKNQPDDWRGHAQGKVGLFPSPAGVLSGTSPSVLENLADQVLYAHALAVEANDPSVVGILDLALFEIGIRLAEDESGPGAPTDPQV